MTVSTFPGTLKADAFGIGSDVISSFTNLSSLAGLTYAAQSFVTMDAAGTFGLDTNTYLTAEADTLATVTGRGDTTTTQISIDSDSNGLILGDGQDAKLYYNGTNLVIDPKVVGAGYVDLNGGSLLTAGAGRFDTGVGIGHDPTATEFLYIYKNVDSSVGFRVVNMSNGTAARSIMLIGPVGNSFGMSSYQAMAATVRYRNSAVFAADSGLSGGIRFVLPSANTADFVIELGDSAGNAKFRVKKQSTAEVLSIDSNGNLITTGNISGKLVPTTAASDPQDATPANRPAGTLYQIIAYSGKLYFCTNAATPTWEKITSA